MKTKAEAPVPLEKLDWFRRKIGLGETELAHLRPYRDTFAEKKEDFSQHFHEFFTEIPETRILLEHENRSVQLKQAWSGWFGSLFREGFTKELLAYLWRSGLRHVDASIDQRYVNLGYSFVRHFCRRVARNEVPAAAREEVSNCIDKMIDFCVLIETDAYITATSQCDMEVVKGISHQVRNPLTVIGGNILRLKRQAKPDSSLFKIYETILGENMRLEKMVADVVAYSEMYEKEPNRIEVSLEEIISTALGRLKRTHEVNSTIIEIQFDHNSLRVHADPEDLEAMFYHLLRNSLEAVDPQDPCIRISSRPISPTSAFLEIEIFNNGKPPAQEDLDNLFTPFYSLKAQGTGFGLPIAQLAARKNLGDLYLEVVPNEGTKCVISLPLSPKGSPRNL